MIRKRPKTIYLLLAVFTWSLWTAIDLLLRGATSVDVILYDEAGLRWLVVTLLSTIAFLDAAAIKYLRRPAPVGRIICLASLAVSALETSIAYFLGRMSPETLSRALVVSRESRGLAVRQEALDFAMNPTISLALWIGSLLLSAGLAALVIRQWHDFGPSSAPAAAESPADVANA